MSSSGQDGGGDPAAGAADASRRTHLANERTFLAWWRSGLASIALAVAIGAVLPQIADADGGRNLGLIAVGAGFGLLGVIAVVYGAVRERAVARALSVGGYAPLPARSVAVLSIAAVLLGVGAIVLVVFD